MKCAKIIGRRRTLPKIFWSNHVSKTFLAQRAKIIGWKYIWWRTFGDRYIWWQTYMVTNNFGYEADALNIPKYQVRIQSSYFGNSHSHKPKGILAVFFLHSNRFLNKFICHQSFGHQMSTSPNLSVTKSNCHQMYCHHLLVSLYGCHICTVTE